MVIEPFSILLTYFKEHSYPFTKHHIDSFRELLRRHIPETIASFNPITMVKFDDEDPNKVKIKVEVFVGGDTDTLQLYIDRPTYTNEKGEVVLLTPYEARLKNYSYMAHLLADVTVRYTEEGKDPYEKVFKRTWIGEIPIMLHSDICILHEQGAQVLKQMGECMYDQGGYFIIDGKEKVIVSQERITTNRLFIEETPKDMNFSHRAHIHCTGEKGETVLSPRTITFYIVRRELPKSPNDDDIKNDLRKYRGAIMVSIPSISGTMPLFELFRLLGVSNDKDILETILGPMNEQTHKAYLDFLYPSIRHCADIEVFTQEQALHNVAPRTYFKSVEQVHAILVNDIFPNMNEHRSMETNTGLYEEKAKLLGQLVYDIAQTYLGVRPVSDRDGYAFKRIDISGFLLAQLFQSAYIQVKNTCRDTLDSHYHYIIKNKGQLSRLITPDNIRKFLQPSIMSDIMNRSLKGRWGPKPEDPDQEVVQDLGRISYIGFMSHLRRVNLPLDRSIKITSPHRLHSQQWGIMCPFESPDGASIGYLKNFALLSQVTFGTDSDILYKCLQDLGMIPLEDVSGKLWHQYTTIYLNGQWIGCTQNPVGLVQLLRLYRRNSLINLFTSISWDIPTQTIRVLTEAGRACRPLLIVESQQLLIQKEKTESWFSWIFGKKWKDIHVGVSEPKDLYYKSYYIPFEKAFPSVKHTSLYQESVFKALESHQACLEYLDIEEENTRLIAMVPEDVKGLITHCEIHPSTIFSIVTNNIPFSNHNQAPRNIFHGSQTKQAIGVYTTNFTKRFDTMGYIQHYPQRPIITTRNSQFTMNDKLPNGFNVIVAVMSYTGYNQEDGIMINKASIDRGLFNITAYKSLSVSEEKLNEMEEVIFANPTDLLEKLKDTDNAMYASSKPTIRNFHPEKTNYELLDEHGVIMEESYVPSGQSVAVVGVVKRTKKYVKDQQGILSETKLVEEYENLSIHTDVHHYGKIDKVYLEKKTSKMPYRICKVRFRKVRKPELGDKHCSRHGQKGVIGMIHKEENMPFTKDGIRPDIIINPHAFPSRMTIGHLVECVFSKLCCMEGTLGDGSVFVPFNQEVVCDNLEKHGFEKYGNELLYDGFTGQQIPSEVFIGPTFYLRLKHMVADKVHARGVGFSNPHDQLTHQPTSGRSHMGGLRIGEMERDSLLSHGLAQFIKESMMERSDKYRWLTCKHCGVLMHYTETLSQLYCRSCQHSEFNMIETPYAMKLLVQEMEAMGLSVRISNESFIIEDEEDLIEIETDDKSIVQEGGTSLSSPEPPLVPEGQEAVNGEEVVQPGSDDSEVIESDVEQIVPDEGEGASVDGEDIVSDEEVPSEEASVDGEEVPSEEASVDEEAPPAEGEEVPAVDGEVPAIGGASQEKKEEKMENLIKVIMIGGDA
jgi:DNA-directed RNA polymerase II subunit RPB2